MKTKQKSSIPARYVFGIMAMLGVMMAYLMRACLSIAITQMVIQNVSKNYTSDFNEEEVCSSSDYSNLNLNQTAKLGQFQWSEKMQGLILSAFYYGYIITHIPGGLLAQKFGGKYTMGLGILCTAIFTLLTPIVAYIGAIPLMILRFLEGVGEGVTFPALCTMLAQWAPPDERSTLAAGTFTGVQVGTVMANLLGGIILEYVPGGWEAMFYIFGGASIIWFLLWCVLCYNDPSSHPFISEKEKLYLKETIGEIERKKDLGPMPWKSILTSVPVWALIIGEVGHDWGLYTMVSDLPKYMSDVIKFNPAENGLWSSLPYFATWICSLTVSALADWLLRKEYLTVTTLRKTFATIGAIGPAIGVIGASYVGCNKTMVILFFTAGMGFMGFCYSSLRVNALDLSPHYAGTIMALVNGFGCISGMIAPVFTGLLTPRKRIKEWRNVFWVMVFILVSTNLIFVLYGSGEQQEWNGPVKTEIENESDEKNEKEKGNSNL